MQTSYATKILWQPPCYGTQLEGYTLHYLSEDDIWSKVADREQTRQYLHLLSYVFFQCWFIQMHITVIMIKEWPHKWHHKCWLVRWTPIFVHLQQWKHTPFVKQAKLICISSLFKLFCSGTLLSSWSPTQTGKEDKINSIIIIAKTNQHFEKECWQTHLHNTEKRTATLIYKP